MKKAILFDMDGLMINSERLTYSGYVLEMMKRGYDVHLEEYKTFLGRTTKDIFKLLREYYGQDFDAEDMWAGIHRYMNDYFENVGVPLKMGLLELLCYLKGEGYILAVASSSSRERVEKILTLGQIRDYFDCLVCGDEITHGKPDPEIFDTACRKINVNADEVIILEDSEAGIEAGYRGHYDVICVPDLKCISPQHQDMTKYIASDLTEVLSVIDAGI